jgi:DNA-binding transcriptional LysR family regulator
MASLRALECFVAAVDAGSMSDAAARLYVSQSALSQQVSALEREVGTPLLERLPRGVRPTAAGRAMLADARVALDAAARTVAAGQAVAAGKTGRLRLGCAESMTVPLLAPVIRHWRTTRPDVELTLSEATSADVLVRGLEAGELDVALGPRPEGSPGHSETVGREEIVVAIPVTHELSTVDRVAVARLAEHPLVHYDRGNGLGSWLDGVVAGLGVALTAAIRTRHATTAAQLAAAGLGPALVPTTALPPRFSGLVRRLDPVIDRQVVTLVANPADALARRFARDLRRRGVPVPPTVADQLVAGERDGMPPSD